MTSSPYFSPVIYCGAKYAAICGVCLNSLNPAHAGRFATSTASPRSPFGRCAMSLHSVNYASFAAHATRFAGPNLTIRQPSRLGACPYPAKTPHLTTSFAPRDENR